MAKVSYGMTIALICLAHMPMARSAMAITVELAKKCEALTDKAYPLRVAGNPAAGRENGTAKEAQSYYTKCVAKKGDIDNEAPKPANRIQRHGDESDGSDQGPSKKRTFPDGLL
jgi:hypothetical protein